jgi:hypothetical protein
MKSLPFCFPTVAVVVMFPLDRFIVVKQMCKSLARGRVVSAIHVPYDDRLISVFMMSPWLKNFSVCCEFVFIDRHVFVYVIVF